MYTLKDIEALLPRFMAAETTEEEEALMAEFFRTTKNLPEELRPYAEMFQIFDKLTLSPALSLKGEGDNSSHSTGQSKANDNTPSPFRERAGVRVLIAAAACIAAIVVGVGLMSRSATVHKVPMQGELAQTVMDALLAPTADDTLRWQMDEAIESELAQSGCTSNDFLCTFNSHSQLIEDNHDPLYVNNVLGRLLALCRKEGLRHTNRADRQMCIDTLELLSAELRADVQNANNLGVGLCQQCIRALGGTPRT